MPLTRPFACTARTAHCRARNCVHFIWFHSSMRYLQVPPAMSGPKPKVPRLSRDHEGRPSSSVADANPGQQAHEWIRFQGDLPAREDVVYDRPVFIPSKDSNPVLAFQGHLYYFKQKEGRWRCRHGNKKRKCPSAIKTQKAYPELPADLNRLKPHRPHICHSRHKDVLEYWEKRAKQFGERDRPAGPTGPTGAYTTSGDEPANEEEAGINTQAEENRAHPSEAPQSGQVGDQDQPTMEEPADPVAVAAVRASTGNFVLQSGADVVVSAEAGLYLSDRAQGESKVITVCKVSQHDVEINENDQNDNNNNDNRDENAENRPEERDHAEMAGVEDGGEAEGKAEGEEAQQSPRVPDQNPLWSGTNKNRDVSTGPLARPFARSLAPLTRGKVNF